VHSFYRSSLPSGENMVVRSQLEALTRAGLDVRLFSAESHEREKHRLNPAQSALRVASGRGRSPLQALRSFDPDVVHVHNLFPNFGRSWVEDLDRPLVATLHNFRPICVNGLLFREGAVCTLCPDGRRWSGVRYACYRDSHLASLPQAIANLGGPAADPVLRRARQIVVPADLVKRAFVDAGLDGRKMLVQPHFLPIDMVPDAVPVNAPKEGWVYVGRLSPEKGILRLVERWPSGHSLTVVGSGPASEQVVRLARGKAVQLLGLLDRHEVIDLMGRSAGLLFPSMGFETFGLVYLEALASGLPVVAWRPNVVSEQVVADGTGRAAGWDEDLSEVLAAAGESFPGLREHCRSVFERLYGERAFVTSATGLYAELAGRLSRT
jgi:glycosyltransferase involved in cell wall biosynthesis